MHTHAPSADEIDSKDPGHRELLEWVADALAGYTVPGRRLLEVGSGTDLFLSIADEHGWQARGVEPPAGAVRQDQTCVDVDLRQDATENLDGTFGSADAVVMLNVIERLTDPLACLRQLRTIVADEGILALTTVALAERDVRARRKPRFSFARSHHLSFSPQALATMLRRAGFRMVEYSAVPRSSPLSRIAGPATRYRGVLALRARAITQAAGPGASSGRRDDIVFVAARPDTPA